MTKYFGLERSTLLHEHLDPWIGHVRLDGCIPQEKGCVGTAIQGNKKSAQKQRTWQRLHHRSHQRGRQSQRSHHEASSLSFAGAHAIVSADAVTFCITSLSQALQKQRFIYNILSMILKFVWALGGSCCLSDLHGISPLDIHLISVFNRGAYRSLHPDSQPHGPGNTCLGHQFSTSPRRRPKSDAK